MEAARRTAGRAACPSAGAISTWSPKRSRSCRSGTRWAAGRSSTWTRGRGCVSGSLSEPVDRAQSRFPQDERQEQEYESDREQEAEGRQDRRQSPGVDPIAHEGPQESEGGADPQLRHGDHGRAERGGNPLVERIQEEHAAETTACLEQEPEQYPAPAEK